ncbi:MAG: ATP-binding protein [Myxococcota bacterium]|nr:ATP-binding protein [Myxococcota bacterium]
MALVPWAGIPLLAGGLVGVAVFMQRDDRRASRHAAQAQRLSGIVDRKVRERTMKLEDDIEQYRAIVENLDAVAFEYDVKKSKVVYIAPQAARLLECELDELTPAHILASIHRDDRAAIAGIMDGGQHDGPIDCRLITARGRVIHTRTFLSARGNSRRIRGLTIDVTREKQLETELRQAQKLESVGRMAAGIAHEINTPIQYISDSVDFVRDALADIPLEDDYLRENIPTALVRAADGAARIARIVASMKAFAHDRKEMTAVDINQTIENTLTLSSNEYRYVADVVTDLGAVPAVWLHAGDLQQVLLNIVVNAAEAIADNAGDFGLARRGRITIKTRNDGKQVVISIADTGSGMSDPVRAQIFEPFFTTKAVGKGVGQGLAVARSLIVERYHGSLVFESQLGHGTEFTIRLPAFTAEDPMAGRAPMSGSQAKAAA